MSKLIRKAKSHCGFSLLELIAVVAIIGIIASLILPRVSNISSAAREKTCYHNRAQLNAAVERYFVDKGGWPANDLSDIAADTDYFPEGIPACPVSGAQYTLNATTHRINGHTGSGKGGGH